MGLPKDETGISAIICTYNGKQKLAPTLTHLIEQKQLDAIKWEIVIVDNASTDGTIEWLKDSLNVVDKFNKVNLFEQPASGKAAALKLAIEKSKHKYLVICDDDNWLNENYLARIFEIFENNAKIGIIGGSGSPVNPELVPTWIKPHLHNFAAAKQWENSADITSEIGSVYGAGMGIRKEIFDKIILLNWPTYLSTYRKTNFIISGEDTEVSLIARHLGYRIYYDEILTFKHDLSSKRLTKKYLNRWAYFGGSSAAIMLPYHEAFEKKKQKAIAKLLALEIYRLLRYDLAPLMLRQSVYAEKNMRFRLGYIKSLMVNQAKIKNLRKFLKATNT